MLAHEEPAPRRYGQHDNLSRTVLGKGDVPRAARPHQDQGMPAYVLLKKEPWTTPPGAYPVAPRATCGERK